ncbi:MAG: NAD-dependent epimerase/dehydratase family protein, partial [Rhodocyclaceae bacterium]|nr:NAD-dependent epimerase/dehydratase family protein [Rhodocyclaceae bacterium]
MRILLTGCAGFIGMHTCERLIARGDEVVGVDNLNDYYDPALKQA